MATRPTNVPVDATCVYPGQLFMPGFGVQQLTLISIEAQIAKQNNNSKQVYTRAMHDWAYNAQWAIDAHQKVPPMPQKPQLVVMQIVYADVQGTVVEPPEGADGLHYAWTWETYE